MADTNIWAGFHERFDTKYVVSDSLEFNGVPRWIWMAYRASTGYGMMRHTGKLHYAHRISYMAHTGPIPDGLIINHRCERRPCVQPAHLEVVTPSQNVHYNKPPPKNKPWKSKAKVTKLESGWQAEWDRELFFLRFADKYEVYASLEFLGAPCWIWTASRDAAGYGRMLWGGMPQMAHRLSYVAYGGQIPEGFHVAHLCDRKACVQPTHLKAVTRSENMRYIGKGTCQRGHVLDGVNRSPDGRCRTCRYVAGRKAYAMRVDPDGTRGIKQGQPQPFTRAERLAFHQQGLCAKGIHPWTARHSSRIDCKKCHNLYNRTRWANRNRSDIDAL